MLAAARSALAEDGVEAVSMRQLARRLGVAPNALYSHVASREELIDALLDDTLNEVRAPDPWLPWSAPVVGGDPVEQPSQALDEVLLDRLRRQRALA